MKREGERGKGKTKRMDEYPEVTKRKMWKTDGCEHVHSTVSSAQREK